MSPTSNNQTQQYLIAVELDFLILKEARLDGTRDFVLIHTKEEQHDSIIKIRQQFSEKESPVFMEHVSWGYTYLGNIVWEQLGVVSNSIRGSFMAMTWKPDSFVLRVQFSYLKGVDIAAISDHRLSTEPYRFRDLLLSASSPPPIPICRWLYSVDESLAEIHDNDALLSWSKTHPLKQFGHHYSSFDSFTTVLQIMLPKPMQYHWRFSQLPPSMPPYSNAEVEAAIKYRATMEEFSAIKQHAEHYTKQALALDWQDDISPVSTGFWGQLASLHPHYDDELSDIQKKIALINQSTMFLYEDLRKLNYLFLPYQYNFLMLKPSLKLAHVGYEMAPLVEMKIDEVGQLTLPDYYKRSALSMHAFYRDQFRNAAEQLEKLLENWRVASSIRMEQQTVQLNRLVLLLTITSAILATLQVIVAIQGWNSLQVLGIFAVVLLVSVIILVICANKRVQRSKRSSNYGHD